MEHYTGCPVYTPPWLMIFLDNNAWFAGIILVGIGVPIGLFGKPHFNEITAGIAFLFFF
jgi:hypothetical protein